MGEGEEIKGLYTQLKTNRSLGLAKVTPSHLDVLGHRMLSNGAHCFVDVFVIGGEALSRSTVRLWRRIQPKARLLVEEVELDTGSDDAAEQFYARFHPRGFRLDVRQAPLLRLYIAYDAARESWLMMLLHNLAIDHVIFEAMQSEVEAHLLGQEALLRPLPFRNLVVHDQMGRISEE